jgi:hypothetical protein
MGRQISQAVFTPSASRVARHLANSPSSRSESYSIFDSALYRIHAAEWLFPQGKATFHDLKMSTSESKML